ncbi:hypothetical protein [Edaphobacter sp.]|uniref:hypothetical protein n=1 Tax=Edaphobacter sp. TaxID=1934404 RepID=UPI002DB9C285|nr:hypothetical protein [Edaphobacter sp.]HEU5341286.1 hypothetical protein [Edaphobacter sp.]
MFKTIGSYIFWAYERGSVQYDVMVTLILVFMFLGPHFIDFHDKPVETVAIRASQVLVNEAGREGDSNRFVYQIRIDDIKGANTDDQLRAAILRVIEPISGTVVLERYEPVLDSHGKIIAYNAWVLR